MQTFCGFASAIAKRRLSSVVIALTIGYTDAVSGGMTLGLTEMQVPSVLPDCGTQYAEPMASPRDDVSARSCGTPTPRNYKPKFMSVGYQVLNDESEACFVEDQAFQLLDEVIQTAVTKISGVKPLPDSTLTRAEALKVSHTIGNVLEEYGFLLYVPTDNFRDAMIPRKLASSSGKHLFDCDMGTLLYLSVAEAIGIKASMVDIRLPSGAGHNYVRWTLGATTLDWDTNGRAECRTPQRLPSWQGASMSTAQTLGYFRALRAALWERRGEFQKAIEDFSVSTMMYPESPMGYNNFAWLIATKEFPERRKHLENAKRAAETAVAIERSANNLDTLACIYALTGDFSLAAEIEAEAVGMPSSNRGDFESRLKRFKAVPPIDCTGEK